VICEVYRSASHVYLSIMVHFQLFCLWFIQHYQRKDVVLGALAAEVYRVNFFAQKLFAGSLFEGTFILIDILLDFKEDNAIREWCEEWTLGRETARQLMSALLSQLPVVRWTQGNPRETCAVCIQDFIEQEEVRVFPCSHGQFFLILNFLNGP